MMRTGPAAMLAAAIAFFLVALTVLLDRLVRFAQPEWLAGMALPVGMIAARLFFEVARAKTEEAIGHIATVREMIASSSPRFERARFALVVVAAVLLVIAMARPQWGERSREVRRSGIDVVFALDISRSMLADDIAPSRLRAATEELDRLMRRLEGDRVGLVVFAGIGFAQSPLTSDYGAIRLYMDRLDPEDLPVQGTAIGRAITEAHRLLTGRGSERFGRADTQIIIVVSDGEDHEGDPVEAAASALRDGIRVYTVGIGTEAGARIPVFGQDGSVREHLRDSQGNEVTSRLEEQQLIDVAQAGGGTYRRYAGEGSVASFLERSIEAYDEEILSTMLAREYADRYEFFAAPALVLLGLSTLLRRRPRVRQAGLAAGSGPAVALAALGLCGCDDLLRRPDPRVEQAMELLSLGSGDAALERLSEAPEAASVQPEFHYDRALALLSLGRFDEARSELLDALGSPDPAVQGASLTALGTALMGQERWREAIERFRRALLLDPGNETARHNLEVAIRRLFPPCATLDDDWEQNDDATSAAELPRNAYTGDFVPPGSRPAEGSGEVSFVACPGDGDWFRIPVLGGDTLDATLQFRRLREDDGGPPLPSRIVPASVRIALLMPDGVTPIAVDQGLALASGEDTLIAATPLERALSGVAVDPALAEAGFVLLHVASDPPLEYRYDISISVQPPCWGIEDEHEQNDSMESATSTDTGPWDARLCSGDDDWYTTRLELGDTLFLDLPPLQQNGAARGDAEVAFFVDEDGDPVRVERLGELGVSFRVDEEELRHMAAVRVRSEEGAEGDYQLQVYRFPPCPAGDDPYEEADTAGSPAPLQADEGPFRHLRICGDDSDWFRVTLPPPPDAASDGSGSSEAAPAPRPFSALASIGPVDADIFIDLYDPATGTLLARSVPLDQVAEQAGGSLPPGLRAPGSRDSVVTPGDPGQPGSDSDGSGVANQSPPGSSDAIETPAVPSSAEPAGEAERGAVAATVLPAGASEVIVAVYGAPAFYDLSFPHTEAEQQQQEGGGECDNPQEGDGDSSQAGSSGTDRQEQQGQEQEGQQGEQSQGQEEQQGQSAEQGGDARERGEEQDPNAPRQGGTTDGGGEQDSVTVGDVPQVGPRPEEDGGPALQGEESPPGSDGDQAVVSDGEGEVPPEEAQRMQLLNLLNGLEETDNNLQLQQALENLPPIALEQQW